MPPLLPQRLAALRARLRQTLLAYGLGWTIAVVVGAVLATCLADWLLHIDDAGVRVIVGLAIVAAGGWVAWRRLFVPLRVPLSDVDLALRIEDRYPGFHDSLASSVQFAAAGGDRQIGSPALQQAVVRETLARLETIDTSDVVQTCSTRRAAGAAAFVCLLAASIASLDRPQTVIALERLVSPFSGPNWPRRTNLRLLDANLNPIAGDTTDALRTTRGEPLKIYAENSTGRLPDKVLLEFRRLDESSAGEKSSSEAMRPLSLRDAAGNARELAMGELPTAHGDLEFRVLGGDDATAWRRLAISPAPLVETLNVTIEPPAYLHRAPQTQPEGAGNIQGFIGTRVHVVAGVNKPLGAAALRIKEQPPQPIEIPAGSRELRASFVVVEPGVYSWWLELTDAEGFENPSPPRYEVVALTDAEPDVRIDVPASDLLITADAEVAVRTTAKDDIGLKELWLSFTRRDLPAEAAGASEDDPAESAPPAAMGRIDLFDGQGRPGEHIAEYLWQIGKLGVSEGAQIVFRAEATDDFDLSDAFPEGQAPPPHVGRSIARTLTVVSKADKLRELAQQQAGLLDELERALTLQKQSHDQVNDLVAQLRNTGELRAEDIDALQRAELGQREVAGQLSHPALGLGPRAQKLLDDLRANHIDDAPTEQRLSEIVGELGRLGDENLPLIESELTRARKLAQSRAPASPSEKGSGTSEPSEGFGENHRPERGSPPVQQPATPGDEQSRKAERQRRGKQDARNSGDSEKAQKSAVNDAADVAGRQRRAADGEPPAMAPLQTVAENQREVLDSISELVQQLSQWRTEQDAARELSEVSRDQRDLNRKTADLGQQTLTKLREQLTPQERADLDKLAERQKTQADRLDQLRARLHSRLEELSRDNPGAQAALEQALDQARDLGVSEQMREAAGQIGENRMGAALTQQQEVLEKLHEIEKTLADQRETGGEALVKQLKQAESGLEQLVKREALLQQKMRELAQDQAAPDREAQLERLRREQKQVREEAARLARRLSRLQAQRPSASLQRAARRMQQAEEQFEQGAGDDAAETREEAAADLEQAQRELARERRQAEEQLAREQLEKIADRLQAMIGRQQAVIDETGRLEEIRRSAGRFTRGQLATLQDLSTTERSLQEETETLAEKVTAAEVFAMALRGAARRMQQAASLLEDRQTGEETLAAEQAARLRYTELIDALKKDEPPQGQEPQPGQQQQQQQQQQESPSGPPSEGIPAIAQLKMLLSLQRDLLSRTGELQARQKAGQGLTPEQTLEFESLAREQADLADLARNLSQLASEPADEPDADQKPDN